MSSLKNVDAMIVQDMNERATNSMPAPTQNTPEPIEVGHGTTPPADQTKQEAVVQPEVAETTPPADQDPYGTQQQTEAKEKPADDKPTSAENSPIDEYGNPVEKPKMYTEEEVNRIMRDRARRGAPQATPQQVQQAKDNFQVDPNSEETWETQLERFVEHTIDKKEKKAAEEQWKAQENAKQADFEARFTTGMNKYSDFQQVVAGKPITDTMLLAARSLENPAAFVYGAAKMHPAELESISKIADPYAQAAAVGRLHEKMLKNNVSMTKAPIPLHPPKSDMPAKGTTQPSIEDRIAQYAKQKRK